MTWKRFAKILLLGLGVLLCIPVALIVFVFFKISSRNSVRHVAATKSYSVPSFSKHVAAVKRPCPRQAKTFSEALRPELKEVEPTSNSQNSLRNMHDLMDSSKPLSSVCSALYHKQDGQIARLSSQELGRRLRAGIEGGPSDARTESVEPILRFLLTRPALRALILRMEKMSQSEISRMNELTGQELYPEISANSTLFILVLRARLS